VEFKAARVPKNVLFHFSLIFFKFSRGAGSQFSFFGSFFTSFLMVYVYKNEKKWIKNENCEHPYYVV